MADPDAERHHRRRFRRMFRLLNIWPPLRGAGIRVLHLSADVRTIEVRLKKHWWNDNAVGTHFGGSLYAMCDPWFMLMLIYNLGPDYIVWDKSAAVRFKRPGVGTLRARFHIPDERIEQIRQQADREEKVEPVFTAEIGSAEGEVVAEVEKLLDVRKRFTNDEKIRL